MSLGARPLATIKIKLCEDLPYIPTTTSSIVQVPANLVVG